MGKLINNNSLFMPAAQPIHWVYAGMEKVLEGVEHPEFRPTSANPYYTIATGNQSPYGDLLLSLLESLAECGSECYIMRTSG